MDTDVSVLYEEIADWFDTNRPKSLIEREYLHLSLKHAPTKGTMLDLGCGTGEPIAFFFVRHGLKVTGVDFSHNMLDFCVKRFPNESWIEADMRSLNIGQRFDIVFAWDSFFHLDRDAQRKMFPIFRDHLSDGGILVFNSGTQDGEKYGTMQGRPVYHASLDAEEYRTLLARHGLQVILNKIDDSDCGGRTVWVSRYRQPRNSFPA